MIIGALAILVAVTWLARRALRNSVLSRLRALIPAWRFFDRAALPPHLLIRWAAPDASLGAWAPLDGGPRGVASWAFAPRANLFLAYGAALNQLVAEVRELELANPAPSDVVEADPAIVGRVSYALVSRIARAHVPAAVRTRPGARYQWKLVVPGVAPADDENLLSPELSA